MAMIEDAEKFQRICALEEARRQESAARAKLLREGMPAVEGTVFDKFDPRNAQQVAGNDNK